MQFSTLLLGALAVLPAALAVGNARVTNNCAYPVYLWSVGSSVSAKNTITTGSTFSEPYRRDATTGGIALKITKVNDGLFIAGTPQMVLAYTLDPQTIWYDLSDVFGDAFQGSKVTLVPSDTSCRSVVWPSGTPVSGPSTSACGSNSNVTLTLCAT